MLDKEEGDDADKLSKKEKQAQVKDAEVQEGRLREEGAQKGDAASARVILKVLGKEKKTEDEGKRKDTEEHPRNLVKVQRKGCLGCGSAVKHRPSVEEKRGISHVHVAGEKRPRANLHQKAKEADINGDAVAESTTVCRQEGHKNYAVKNKRT